MSRKIVSALLLGAVVVACGCQTKNAAAPVANASPSNATLSDDEKACSALGSAMGTQAAQQLKALNLTPAEQKVFEKALIAAIAGTKSEFDLQQWGSRLQARAEKNATAAAATVKQGAAAFLAGAAQESGAVQTASGLVFKSLKAGSGPSPKATDVVKVHYHGTLPDGKVFDSSVQRGQPVDFPLNRVIPCWSEGVQRMKVGEKAKLVCPSQIAYGDRGTPDGSIPGGAALVFEVQLLAINPPAQARAGQ